MTCSWGWNGDGQLGLGDVSNRTSPELIEIGGESMTSISKVPISLSDESQETACIHWNSLLHT